MKHPVYYRVFFIAGAFLFLRAFFAKGWPFYKIFFNEPPLQKMQIVINRKRVSVRF